MDSFRVTRIAPDAFSILDKGESSFYVVVGEKRAAVIDTGITPGGKIMPVLRGITDKPLLLIITHAHIDHLHHMDEFDEVYMCHRELELPAETVKIMLGGKKLNLTATRGIVTGDRIDLGGETMEICQVPGHSPGSVVILARAHDLLFTGDAIGSGYGVWMQVPGALPLSGYYESLTFLMKWLMERGGRMKFFGGHRMQQFQSMLIPGFNPLNMGLLSDLTDLVEQVVRGELVGRASNADKCFGWEPAFYASYGRAELQYLKSRIQGCAEGPQM